jgi:hypothetical protein
MSSIANRGRTYCEVRTVKNTHRYPDGSGALRRSPAGLRTTEMALVLMFCGFATGCVAPKRASLIVPRRCLKVDAKSFTRPCVQRADGKLVCDGVVVTATCVEVSH